MPAVMEAIDHMTTSEKFETMDYLWASLYSTFAKSPSVNAIPSVDDQWLDAAKRRRSDILSGRVRTIPTSEILAEAKARIGA